MTERDLAFKAYKALQFKLQKLTGNLEWLFDLG